MFYLFEGLPKLSSRSHAQLLCDVSWNFEQQNLHQARHQPILTNTDGRNKHSHKTHICLQWSFFKCEVFFLCIYKYTALENQEDKTQVQKRLKALYRHFILLVHHASEIFISPLTMSACCSPLHCLRAVSNSKSTMLPYSEYTVLSLPLFHCHPVCHPFCLSPFLAFFSLYLLFLFFTLPPLSTPSFWKPDLFDGLLNLIQVDVFGFPQQRILVHLQHRHPVLAQLHHHHVWLHSADRLCGEGEKEQRVCKIRGRDGITEHKRVNEWQKANERWRRE